MQVSRYTSVPPNQSPAVLVVHSCVVLVCVMCTSVRYVSGTRRRVKLDDGDVHEGVVVGASDGDGDVAAANDAGQPLAVDTVGSLSEEPALPKPETESLAGATTTRLSPRLYFQCNSALVVCCGCGGAASAGVDLVSN